MNSITKTLATLALGGLLSACNATPEKAVAAPACNLPAGNDLGQAFDQARADLATPQCARRFDSYLTALMQIAEGDPAKENPRHFSDFMVWASDRGVISKRQARETWSRYFSPRYVSLSGEYNNCSHVCPRLPAVLDDMKAERADKEWGLMSIAADASSFGQADRLYHDAALVLEATCRACGPERQAAR